jgi:hypothetical protein
MPIPSMRVTAAARTPLFMPDPVAGNGSLDSFVAERDVVDTTVVADGAELTGVVVAVVEPPVGAAVVDVGATVEDVVVVVVAEVAKPVGLNRSKNASRVPSADLFTTAVSGSKSTVLAKTPTR